MVKLDLNSYVKYRLLLFSTELSFSAYSQPQKVEESFCISVPETSEVKTNSLGFIHFILQSALLHVPKGSTREPDT